mgnify:CR=1 FL=1
MSPSTPIRLVALDLDGTLLDSQSQISPAPGRPLPMPSGAGSSCYPAPGGPLPACRRWWRSFPASDTPSPPTVPLSGIWAQTRWVLYTAVTPMPPASDP